MAASPVPLDRDDLAKYILKIETVEYPIDGALTTAFYQTFQ